MHYILSMEKNFRMVAGQRRIKLHFIDNEVFFSTQYHTTSARPTCSLQSAGARLDVSQLPGPVHTAAERPHRHTHTSLAGHRLRDRRMDGRFWIFKLTCQCEPAAPVASWMAAAAVW